MRESTRQAGRADTYFELNKRQAGLNRLREQAGPNPDPVIKADLDEFQRRLDADRVLLDKVTREIIDPATIDILREGLPPIDTVAGAANVATGEGGLRDYLAIIPLSVSKVGKVAGKVVEPGLRQIHQLGGSYSAVRRLRGYHAHHIPADKASPLLKGRGPSIAMTPADHQLTKSYGAGAKARAHRQRQRELIERGDFRGAQQLDIDDIREQFGSKYDDAIAEMLDYTRRQGF